MHIGHVFIGMVAGSVVSMTIVSTTTARAQIQPIVIGDAKDHPGCQIYLKSDGSRLRFKGAPIAANDSCPDDFLRGRVTRFGAGTYKLEIPGRTCVINANGYGRCQ
jgi:hypothetical protein